MSRFFNNTFRFTFHQGTDQGQTRMAGQIFITRFDDAFYRSYLLFPSVVPETGKSHYYLVLPRVYINYCGLYATNSS